MRSRSLALWCCTNATSAGCRKSWTGHASAVRLPMRSYTTTPVDATSDAPKVSIEMRAKLPPKWMAERNILFGSAFGCTGVAVGTYAFGAVVPLGVALGSFLPIALGTVYMPRGDVQSRAIVTSSACLPIGMAAAAFLDLAAWPALGVAGMVLGPALAAGYSCYHIAESKELGADLVSAPITPLSRALHTVGLWNQWVPWAHQPFRDTVKLFFWYTLMGAIPTVGSLYGGYQVWLMFVLAWQYSLYISTATMTMGFFATSLPSMIPMEHKGSFMWLLPTATRWGNWLLNNYITHVTWIYAFYAFLPMCCFFLWYKWSYGVSSSPFKADESDGASLYAGQRAFWVSSN